MSKNKSGIRKMLNLFIGIIIFFAVLLLIIYMPNLISVILCKTSLSENSQKLVKILIIVVCSYLISWDTIYLFLLKKYKNALIKAKGTVIKAIIISLISVNDTIIAFPKRTFLFTVYLFVTIVNKFGYDLTGGADLLFAGVVVLGIDRMIKYGKEEIKRISAF